MTSAALCLALNIYFEAAGESIPGKWAVGQVVLNRVESTQYPNTVCDVIKQYKQFSWYWDGKSDKPKEHEQAWKDSVKIANILLKTRVHDFSRGATHYVNPSLTDVRWQYEAQITTVIGNHKFMRF